MFKKLTNLAVTAGVAAAAGGDYDYKQQGADWKDLKDIKDNACGGVKQSPIDLSNNLPSTMVIPSNEDFIQKAYWNIENAETKWTSQTSKVDYPKDEGVFKTWHNWDYRNTSDTWQPAQFHWHGPSEHTISGARFDLELHIVHTPAYVRKDPENNNGYIYAVMGVLFDSSEKVFNEAEQWEIDTSNNLFKDLQWDVTDKNTKTAELRIGEFMDVVDASNRWTYEGSLTTPPCSNSVQWNVIRKVFPVQQKYVDQWKAQMKRETSYDLTKYGNYREIQTRTKQHDLKLIQTDEPADMTALVIVLAILALILLGLTIVFKIQLSRAQSKGEVAPTQGGAVQLEEYDTKK